VACILDLEFDILNALTEGELRPSEIRERLFPKWKKTYDSERSLDVVIVRLLSGKLGRFADRDDRGHQRVHYSLNKNGVEELERRRLKDQLNNWIDEMSLAKIRSWLSRFREHGLRLKFTDNVEVRDKTGNLKGKGLGIAYYTKPDALSERGITFTFTVRDKNGKKLQEYEASEDGKFVRKKG